MSKLLRVLMVEDSKSDAALILRELAKQGYEVICDQVESAEAMLAALRVLWGRVEGQIMTNPQTRIIEVVETGEY